MTRYSCYGSKCRVVELAKVQMMMQPLRWQSMKVSSCSFVFLQLSLSIRHLSIMIQQLLSDQSSESGPNVFYLPNEGERKGKGGYSIHCLLFKYYVAFSYEDQEPDLE